eukprot:TRINITY_DN9704_c0_g1_i1.p1 TRINITY_DN9704_c0_g1~~TRINITY_DN9704_c0_g1_i1.p1  ORF type:complete len:208 (+),score=50.73 TRINITY_DN9704_c0_g1_i1:27-626(+)
MEREDRIWFQFLFDTDLERSLLLLNSEFHNVSGLPSVGHTPGKEDRPHISLFPTPVSTPEQLQALLAKAQELAASFTSFPVRFDSVAQFYSKENKENNNVVFQLTPTAVPFVHHALPVLARFHAAWPSSHPFYTPSSWAPHCTISQGLSSPSSLSSLPLLLPLLRLPYTGHITSIGIYSSNKGTFLHTFPLTPAQLPSI